MGGGRVTVVADYCTITVIYGVGRTCKDVTGKRLATPEDGVIQTVHHTI